MTFILKTEIVSRENNPVLVITEVIRRTAAKGANLILAHEPIYYNHFNETDWWDDDPVYQFRV